MVGRSRAASIRVAPVRIPQCRQPLLEAEVTEGPPCGRAVERGPVHQPEEHPDAACRGLRRDDGAAGSRRLDRVERLVVQVRDPLRLAEPEGDGTSGGQRDVGEQAHLASGAPAAGPVAFTERGCRLENAGLALAEHAGDGHQLALVGVRPGHGATIGNPVQRGAGGREAQGTGRDRLVDRGAHRGDVVVGGRRLVEAALAHRVVSDRAVTDHPADVQALRPRLDRVEIVAVGLPVPVESRHDRVGRHVFDRLHELGEVSAVLGPARRT